MLRTVLAAPADRRTICRSIATLLAATVVVGTAACSKGDSTGPTTAHPAGRYELVQVDKKAVPINVYDGDFYDKDYGGTYPLLVRVTGGEITLEDGGGFHLAIDRMWRTDDGGGDGKLLIDGTYRIDGSKIAIDTNAGAGTGSFQNGDITLSLDVGETGTMKKYTFRRVR